MWLRGLPRIPASSSPMSDKKGTRLRVSSSIDELPGEAREKLEQMLTDANNGLTYQDMVEIMAEDGVNVSKSAIGRYARRYLRHIRRMQVVQEQTRVLLQYMAENPATDLARQINALIQNGLMWRIVDGQDEIEDMSIEDAIKLSLQAQRAAVYEYRYRDSQVERVQIDKEEDDAARVEWLRQKLRDNPELLNHFERATGGGKDAKVVRDSGSDGQGE